MDAASPPPAKGITFRLHDETSSHLGAPRRNLMIVIAGVLGLLVVATTGKAFLAQSMPRTALLIWPGDPVALVETARDEFELTQKEREFADRLPDERLAGGKSPELDPGAAAPQERADAGRDRGPREARPSVGQSERGCVRSALARLGREGQSRSRGAICGIGRQALAA